MQYSKKCRIVDPVVIPKRIAVIMRWNNIGCKELYRELNYGLWYFNRLMAGIESPDDSAIQRLYSIFGKMEMNWVLGFSNDMPPWLREKA